MSPAALVDRFGRQITYLRVSVTDRCNLRCLYCMPEEGVALQPHEAILRYEEIARLVSVAARLGVSKVRITGGEPLVRPGVVELVRRLASIPGISDLAMTTNGVLLAQNARDLAEAGLQRVNVSLDTLRPDRFARLARRDHLAQVLAGLDAAEQAGLTPVKVNTVVIRGLNDDEVVSFARLTLARGWHVRYIEVMPLGEGEHWSEGGFVSALEIKERVEEQLGPLAALPHRSGSPARDWRLPGATGTLGFITPVTEHFCGECNRLRLTADGRLISCLLRGGEVDVRQALRDNADDEVLQNILRDSVSLKPSGHHLEECRPTVSRGMSGIGG